MTPLEGWVSVMVRWISSVLVASTALSRFSGYASPVFPVEVGGVSREWENTCKVVCVCPDEEHL